MVIPHYWNPQQVERLLDSLADLGLRRARVAALIMWRSALRVGETVALEWRDIDVAAGTLLVRRGKGGRGRTVPLHQDLASLFANWPTSYGPRDLVVGLTRKTALRHLRAGNVTSWSGLLVGVCLMMRDSHPGDFERILEIRGRKLPYFSKAAGELNLPRPIGDTGIFASCQGTGALIAGRARRVVEHFGHPAGSLVIQLR